MPNLQTHWHWHLSALFYRFSYIQISHQVDDDLFSYLGERLVGAVVADCGCGPGFVAEKLLRRGAGRVIAIDANSGMLEQARRRLAAFVAAGQVETIHEAFSPEFFRRLEQRGHHPDIVLFKRSLYIQPEEAARILSAAGEALTPEGLVVIVHPERSLRRYAFGPGLRIRAYTPYHLFNRTLSLLAERLGIGPYTIYDRAGLQALVRRALPGFQVHDVPTSQEAYNIVAAHAPADLHAGRAAK